jgi:hypothetical protein
MISATRDQNDFVSFPRLALHHVDFLGDVSSNSHSMLFLIFWFISLSERNTVLLLMLFGATLQLQNLHMENKIWTRTVNLSDREI